MHTVEIFRKAINFILDTTPGLLQKTIALKLNNTVAHRESATSDFNDFLHGRKNYSLKKQERLAQILGYSYIDVLIIGQNQIKNKKVANLYEKRKLKKIMLRDGSNCTYDAILKMTEQILLHNGNFDIQKSLLIEQIVEKWKELKKDKKVI